MEVAKLSSKGQITLPPAILKALKLKTGDKIIIQEDNGKYYFDNATRAAFENVNQAFADQAEEAGFTTEADMQAYMEEIRKEVRGY